MSKSIIAEGKTTNEAIEKGLKELNVSKNDVEIKVLENEDKRSFFNILAPRVVKVEITLKENIKEKSISKNEKKEIVINEQELKIAKERIESFLKEFLIKISEEKLEYSVNIEENNILVVINGQDSGFLIGHRGEVMNSIQNILSSIANKNMNSKIRVLLDIENYREKRIKTLENLAIKISKTVLRTGKSITLEPMTAFERKIIHSKLQNNENITTYSVGEEPHRKIVISKK